MPADKLTDPAVAHAYAGFDKNFTFFKLYTRPDAHPVTGDFGHFFVEYQGYLPELEATPDPVGFLKAAVRAMVAKAIAKTSLPADQWIVEFSPVFERYNIPSHLYLHKSNDRAWCLP